MNKVIHLSLSRKSVPVLMDVVQGATAPSIEFVLDDYTPPGNARARIYILKDGGEVYNDCTLSGNVVTYTPTAGSFDVAGQCVAQLQITQGSNIAVSWRIFVTVEPNLIDGSSVPASTQYGALETLINNAQRYDTDIQTLYSDVASINSDVASINLEINDIRGYIGYADSDIYGLEVDFANRTNTRLAGAVGKTQGANFNVLPWSGMKRCNLADNGTVNAYYGDSGFVEDGSNGQVMVEIPAFYYKVVPLVLTPQTDGIGYHLKKARYYVSSSPKEGFKRHPAFYNANSKPVEKIYLSAYEGCLYDVSAGSYITNDSQVADFSADKLSSIADVKPISGNTQNLTRANTEAIASNRGTGWYNSSIKTMSAVTLLAMIEAGKMDFQNAYGKGVVDYASGSGNEASNTGSTSSLGNSSGSATSTTHTASDGTTTVDTATGKLSVSYRGVENIWGNTWTFESGINIWGDGNLKGGVPYIAEGKSYAESTKTGAYASAGFTITNTNGYIQSLGYGGEDYDWLFLVSEVGGTSTLPVGDYTYITSDLNGFRLSRLGGCWDNGWYAGGFYRYLHSGPTNRSRAVGGRAEYIPQSNL